MSSGYSVPQPVRFSITVKPTSPPHESTVAVPDRVTGVVDLRLVLDQRQDRAARDRLALSRRLDGLRGAVELAILLVVVSVDRRVEDMVLVSRREGDLLRAGRAGNRGEARSGAIRATTTDARWLTGPSSIRRRGPDRTAPRLADGC